MTGLSAPVDECPSCGGEDVDRWDELDTWVCDNCSYVIQKTTSEAPIPQTIDDANLSADESQDWTQSLSIKDKSEANLVSVLSQVEQVSNKLGLSDGLAIRSAEIATEAWENNFMHGRTKSDTVGASVYAASREAQQAIPPAIIADKIEPDRQSVKDTYQQLKLELQLDIYPPTPAEYLERISHKLDVDDKVRRIARKRLDRHQSGGNPVGIAAAAVYVASDTDNNTLTLRGAADVTGLTKETIWRHVSEIREP